MCLVLCHYHIVLITVDLQYPLKTGSVIPLALFFLKIVLTIQGLSSFHTSFRTICSSAMKNTIGTLIGNALSL